MAHIRAIYLRCANCMPVGSGTWNVAHWLVPSIRPPIPTSPTQSADLANYYRLFCCRCYCFCLAVLTYHYIGSICKLCQYPLWNVVLSRSLLVSPPPRPRALPTRWLAPMEAVKLGRRRISDIDCDDYRPMKRRVSLPCLSFSTHFQDHEWVLRMSISFTIKFSLCCSLKLQRVALSPKRALVVSSVSIKQDFSMVKASNYQLKWEKVGVIYWDHGIDWIAVHRNVLMCMTMGIYNIWQLLSLILVYLCVYF